MSLHIMFKKRFLLCLISVIIMHQATNLSLLFASSSTISEHVTRYNRLRTTIQAERENFYNAYHAACKNSIETSLIEQAEAYLLKTITHEIFPFWYGTAWDFNGTTQNPLRDSIACGYFVSTVLRHAGFRLDRYELAQQPASVVINRLCKKESIRVFSHTHQLINHISKNEHGLYIVGLDYHIGFLEKRGVELWFIHSSEPAGGVVREKAEESETLHSSNLLFIGNLLANPNIIKKWLNKEIIHPGDR